MLAKVIRLARYKVIVLSLRPKKGFPTPPEDGVFMNDHDRFFGYSYRQHRAGKYFDLWFTNPKEDDPENFITFGRILGIEEATEGSGFIYVTRMGRFYVEKMECTNVSDQGRVVSLRSANLGLGRMVKHRAGSWSGKNQGNMRAASMTGSSRNPIGKTIPPLVSDVSSHSTRKGRES